MAIPLLDAILIEGKVISADALLTRLSGFRGYRGANPLNNHECTCPGLHYMAVSEAA